MTFDAVNSIYITPSQNHKLNRDLRIMGKTLLYSCVPCHMWNFFPSS